MSKELVGIKWGALKEETREYLLSKVNVWDNKEGECIFDLTDTLSVEGKVVKEEEIELIIDDNAILYNPTIGIINERELNLTIDEVMTVSEAAERWGKTEGAIRLAINNGKLIPGVDYRKAGRITLITKQAMKKLYGDNERGVNMNKRIMDLKTKVADEIFAVLLVDACDSFQGAYTSKEVAIEKAKYEHELLNGENSIEVQKYIWNEENEEYDCIYENGAVAEECFIFSI